MIPEPKGPAPIANQWVDAQRVLGLLSGRWTVAILAELFERGRRYQDLDGALDGVSHKVLTDTLRQAESNGLVTRQVDPRRRETATLYQLTELGRSLQDPLAALAHWAIANWRDVEIAKSLWERRDG
jgi:DNA-binding HxlR family transcriptional regulator